jgi:hypothetical protein
MLGSRRGFLGRLGVGALGVGGLLLPGKALARWRRCGGVACPPPEPFYCPAPVIYGPVLVHAAYAIGPVTVSYPDFASGSIKGNGTFYVWGSLASGYVFDNTDGLHLVSTDGTTLASPVTGEACALLTGAANTFAFRCVVPTGIQFYLKFGYRKPPSTTLLNPTDPWPGPYTAVGF